MLTKTLIYSLLLGPLANGPSCIKPLTQALLHIFFAIQLNVYLFEIADVCLCLPLGIIHARALVRECLAETERSART